MAGEYLSLSTAGEVIASTLSHRAQRGSLVDNLTNHTALLQALTRKARPFTGGNLIIEHLEYAFNESFTWTRGYDEVPIQPNQAFRTAEFDLKEANIAVTISQRELMMNTGREQVFSLLKNRIRNARSTFNDRMAQACYYTGAEFGGKAIGGMQLLVSDTGGGTVGGIEASTAAGNGYWKNLVESLPDSNEVLSASSISRRMSRAITRTARNRDRTNFIVTTRELWTEFERSMQAQQRQASSRSADLGFPSLMLHGHPVVFDDYCPKDRMYFLNTDYIRLRPHSRMNMDSIGGARMPINQNATVRMVGWMGAMTINNRSRQLVLKTA